MAPAPFTYTPTMTNAFVAARATENTLHYDRDRPPAERIFTYRGCAGSRLPTRREDL